MANRTEGFCYKHIDLDSADSLLNDLLNTLSRQIYISSLAEQEEEAQGLDDVAGIELDEDNAMDHDEKAERVSVG